jgi:hypothetical protein
LKRPSKYIFKDISNFYVADQHYSGVDAEIFILKMKLKGSTELILFSFAHQNVAIAFSKLFDNFLNN